MYAGKTSELVRIIRRLSKKNARIKAFKHSLDKGRIIDGDVLCSHDKVTENCCTVSNASEILSDSEYNDTQLIIIEEGQFFKKEIVDVVRKMVNEDNKSVIIAGLSGSAEMKPLGYLHELISCSDEVKLLTALCEFCAEKGDRTEAPFTIKVGGNKNKIQVGTDMYKPTCRKCYNEFNLNK
jgi:thymidine kinase